MQCPDCKQELGNRATYCPCGWRKAQSRTDKPEPVYVPCAYADCGIAAMCKIKTKTGWANLCWQHYDKHFAEQAVENLDKYGMERQPDETRQEHVARMREFVRHGFRAFKGDRQAALAASLKKQQLDALVRDFSSDEGMQP